MLSEREYLEKLQAERDNLIGVRRLQRGALDDAERLIAALRAERQQAQQERDEWEQTARNCGDRVTRLEGERQQAIDALRYIAGLDVAGFDAHMASTEVAIAALVKLGEKP